MQLKEEMQNHLVKGILPYWMNNTIDNANGGFVGRIDGKGQLHEKAGKGSVLNARILWTFSAAYESFQNPDYLKVATRAFDYLLNRFMDKEHGGIYWMLDYNGNPLETKKQVYAQAFAIYGFSAYYNVTGNKTALGAAIDLFHLIEKHAIDAKENGYFEAYDQHWNLLDDLRLSDKDANEKKTMNTHLHILEAYSSLYKIWKDSLLRKQLKNLIQLFLNRFVTSDYRFRLFFDEKWNCKSHEISFGHDIEGSWLLQEAAEVLGDKLLIEKTKKLSISMADAVIRSGIDQDGGLMYEAIPDGITDSDKHWWPQAEAIVGFVVAWQNSNDLKYLQRAAKTWEFTKSKIIDHNNGEWWFRVNKAGEPYIQEDKIGPWKCPYHNGRACLEIVKRL
jgi:mannobiose 2-epimerase